jgi:hypothetical protein
LKIEIEGKEREDTKERKDLECLVLRCRTISIFKGEESSKERKIKIKPWISNTFV